MSKEVCDTNGLCASMTDLYYKDDCEANDFGPGMIPVVITDMETMEDHFIGVAYKKSRKHNGFLLNYCPSCGKSLKFLLDKYEERNAIRQSG